MAQRIEDYALIGDCRTAALVGRDGSIDWLWWPRFDSSACFAALLGTAEHGRWLIAPGAPPLAVRRWYRPGTLVLETEFQTETGVAAVVDFMPPGGGAHLVRIVTGRSGRVDFRTEFVVRFNYGSTVPWVNRLDDGAINAIAGPERLLLRTPAALYGEDLRTLGEFSVAAGDSIPFVLSYGLSFQGAPPAIDPLRMLDDAERGWRAWSDRCPDVGPWTEAVKRSLMTLKALTYVPSGGIVAAATTSLPERLGGVRNWDYRYCWLRDATFTLQAFMHLGYYEEAEAWRDWIMRAVAGSPEPDSNHVRRRRGTLVAGTDRSLAAGLRERGAGKNWQRRAPAAADRRLRRVDRCDGASAQGRHGNHRARPSPATIGVGLSGKGLARAGRRHLGGARRAAALCAFEGHGLGRL